MSLFASAMALVVSLLPPTIYYYQGRQFVEGSIAASAQLKSIQISRLIGRNSQLWRFESNRIDDILFRGQNSEHYIVVALDGEHVTSVGNEYHLPPEIIVTAPLYDAGMHVANLEARETLTPLLLQSLVVAVLTSVLGILSFIALRAFPVRLIRNAMDSAAFLANHDPLTHLPNRALFSNWLTRSIHDADEEKSCLALLSLDLDRFKEVNDTFGHAAGDAILAQATRRMESIIDKTEFLARMGGDEFCIIQTNAPQPTGAAHLSEKLVAELSRPFEYNGHVFDIGVSIGISVSIPNARVNNTDLLLQQSDLALISVKSDGRGTYRFFQNEMNEKLLRRRWLENELQHAVDHDGLELHFQPQVDAKRNGITGLEALCRWKHPKEGWMRPDQFIPIAEEQGLIKLIGDWVFHEACRQGRQWPEQNIAVNVSPYQFRDDDLAATISDALAQTNTDPGRLEIEITEGSLLQNTKQTLKILGEIQALGVRVAMDDFGTGYSSLSYLRKFPFDKIKIDKSFVADLGRGGDAEKIIEAVINLGASLGMVSNAEGVEKPEQAEWLRDHGCDEVQGYYFGKPMTSWAITELLQDEQWLKAKTDQLRPAATFSKTRFG